jgi:hypothetical protein
MSTKLKIVRNNEHHWLVAESQNQTQIPLYPIGRVGHLINMQGRPSCQTT